MPFILKLHLYHFCLLTLKFHSWPVLKLASLKITLFFEINTVRDFGCMTVLIVIQMDLSIGMCLLYGGTRCYCL